MLFVDVGEGIGVSRDVASCLNVTGVVNIPLQDLRYIGGPKT